MRIFLFYFILYFSKHKNYILDKSLIRAFKIYSNSTKVLLILRHPAGIYNAVKEIKQHLFTIHVTYFSKQSEFTYVVFPNECIFF